MNIGIIGAGNIGVTLARKLTRKYMALGASITSDEIVRLHRAANAWA
ncbi:MAG: hypothetical protein KGM60_05035 [Comamonadaceae bacterium]|nr:hypothetical protein [Comamonadaceae bacterium]